MIRNTLYDQDKNTFLYECQWWKIIIHYYTSDVRWFFLWKCVILIPEKYRKLHNSWCFNYLWKIHKKSICILDWFISTQNAYWHILEMINIWTKSSFHHIEQGWMSTWTRCIREYWQWCKDKWKCITA